MISLPFNFDGCFDGSLRERNRPSVSLMYH